MTERFEFDHLSIGVRHPLAVARKLRSELGAEPLTGGVLPQFRYLLMHVGEVVGERVVGSRLELISTTEDPDLTAPGFMHRFLNRHGEAAHHLSFNVPNLHSVRDSLYAAGFDTVQDDLEFPDWQETFLRPDALHGILIQVASTPRPIRTQDLFGTTERRWSSLPNNRDAVDPGWWEPLWAVTVPRTTGSVASDAIGSQRTRSAGSRGMGDRAVLGPVVLGTSDLDRSDVLFRQILRGNPTPSPGEVRRRSAQPVLTEGRSAQARAVSSRAADVRSRTYTWPTGSLVVVEREPGVRGAVCHPPTNSRAGRCDRSPESNTSVGAVRFSAELEDLL